MDCKTQNTQTKIYPKKTKIQGCVYWENRIRLSFWGQRRRLLRAIDACEYIRVNIANLLKRLNLDFAPKCYKMIKTNSHLYVVYD